MANPKRQISVFLNGKEVENSAKSLTNAYRQASNELAKMVVNSDEYLAKLAEVKNIDAALQKHKQNLKGVQEGYNLTKAGLDKLVGVTAGAFAVEQLFAYGRELFNVATRMELMSKKAATVFGESLPLITAEAEKNAAAMGLTNAEYIAAAAGIQDLLVPMGFQRDRAAEISSQLVKLSGALSEWSGGQRSAQEVSEILSGALLGERDALKGLGIDLQEADIKAELAARGLSNLTGDTLKQAEASVTLDLIMRKSVDAQTAYADGAGSLARQQAEAAAKTKEVAERIATLLIPVFNQLVSFAGDVAGFFESVSEGIEKMVEPAKAASKAFDEQAQKVAQLDKDLVPLLDRYDQLITKTNPTKKEQAELGEVIKQIGVLTPTAITEIDKYGNALSINAGKSREFLETEKLRLKFFYSEAIKQTQSAKEEADKQVKILQEQIKTGLKNVEEGAAASRNIAQSGFGFTRKEDQASLQLTAKEIENITQKVAELTERSQGAAAELRRMRGEQIETSTPKPPTTTTTTTGGGTGVKKGKEPSEKDKLTGFVEDFVVKNAQERADTLLNLANLVREESAKTNEQFLTDQQTQFGTIADTNETKLNLDLSYDDERKNAQETVRQALLSDQQAELEAIQAHYDQLLALADRYGINRKGLEEKQIQEINVVKNKGLKETTENDYAEHQARLKAIGDSYTALGNIVAAAGELFAGESARTSKVAKIFALAKIAFDTASAISSLVAASSANPANSTTFGAAGIIQYAVGIVRILANIAQAKKILSTAPAVPQKFEGSYLDVTGAQDGRQYRARSIAAPGTGLLPSYPVLFPSAATGGPVLASERGAEYFVAAKDLQNPAVANHVRMIENITRGGVRQFATGGQVQPVPPATAPGIDPALINLNIQVLNELTQILRSGIIAIIPDGTVTDINKRFNIINKASGGFFS